MSALLRQTRRPVQRPLARFESARAEVGRQLCSPLNYVIPSNSLEQLHVTTPLLRVIRRDGGTHTSCCARNHCWCFDRRCDLRRRVQGAAAKEAPGRVRSVCATPLQLPIQPIMTYESYSEVAAQAALSSQSLTPMASNAIPLPNRNNTLMARKRDHNLLPLTRHRLGHQCLDCGHGTRTSRKIRLQAHSSQHQHKAI